MNICDIAAHPIGNLMRDPKAAALTRSQALPVADAAIAFAFAQSKDGSVNLPTRSIVEKAAQLKRDVLAQRLIFFGSSHANNITEARAMADKARRSGIVSEVISEVAKPILPCSSDSGLALADKYTDMVLLGQELKRLNVRSAYVVAHPLHLWRARLLCEKRFPDVTFYPVEAERSYDWGSNQLRCRAEIFFIPWNILAFIEHYLRGKI